MLFLQDAGLVFLAMPKAASQSIRKSLLPHAADLGAEEPARHINIEMFNRDLRARFEDRIGRRVETFAVVRNPVERLSSWHRYRQRPAIAGTPNSTRGIGFEAFVKATLEPDPLPFAALGTLPHANQKPLSLRCRHASGRRRHGRARLQRGARDS